MKTREELTAEIRSMPGMHATMIYAFNLRNRSHRVYTGAALDWIVSNGIANILTRDRTPSGFLCQSRNYALVTLTPEGREIVHELQNNK